MLDHLSQIDPKVLEKSVHDVCVCVCVCVCVYTYSQK